MKNMSFLLLSALLAGTLSCKKDEIPLTDCIEIKVEEFKQTTRAQAIVRIDKPDETLYWFIDSYVDTGEGVFNTACELVCITDCECGENNIPFCDATHLDFPRHIIWEK